LPLKVGFKQCQMPLFLISIYLFITMAEFRSATRHIPNLLLGNRKPIFKFIGSFNKLYKMQPQKTPDSIGCIAPLSNPTFECQHNSTNPSKRTQVIASHNSRTTSFLFCFFCFPSIILSNFLGKEISSLPIYTF
jgi:hypothetical protein